MEPTKDKTDMHTKKYNVLIPVMKQVHRNYHRDKDEKAISLELGDVIER